MALSATDRTIVENGNRLFSQRLPVLVHWQELAENFYFERADFTMQRSIGEDYAADTFTSRPALYRREMGDLYQSMLRPDEFFEIKSLDDDLNKRSDVRGWLQWATGFQRTVMLRREGGFGKATNACDHDHVTFGQGVVEAAVTPDRRGVFYRNWHLRDVAWSEDFAGNIDEIHRNSCMTLRQAVKLFPNQLPPALASDADKHPYTTVKARHVVVKSDAYEFGERIREGRPWVSLWFLPEHDTRLEFVPRSFKGYVIPRAMTVDGSQYARSPLTGIVLPDARSMQAVERILIEAGEKAVDPPMIGKMGVLRSDMGLYAGGVTWFDQDYDERQGDALRPLVKDYSGLPFGKDLSERFEMSIREGLKTTKVQLPDTRQMTAYQVSKIIEQQIRQQLPLFGPIEEEYSEPLCAETFAIMRSLGAFPPNEIPPVLRAGEIEFSFKSPLKDLKGDKDRQMLGEGMQVLNGIAPIEPGALKLPNGMAIAKDALRSIGWPEDWINNDAAVAAAMEAMQKQAAMQAAMGAAGQIAEGAGKAAPMVRAVNEAQAA